MSVVSCFVFSAVLLAETVFLVVADFSRAAKRRSLCTNGNILGGVKVVGHLVNSGYYASYINRRVSFLFLLFSDSLRVLMSVYYRAEGIPREKHVCFSSIFFPAMFVSDFL